MSPGTTELRHEQVTTGGASVHTVTGRPADAPALVLLHGWPESWATWRTAPSATGRSTRTPGGAPDGRDRRPGGRHRRRGALPARGGHRGHLAGDRRVHRRGSLFAYLQDHDGVTLELIQLAAPEPRQPEGHTP